MTGRSIILLAATILILSILACNPPIPQPPDTITPYAPATTEPTTPSGSEPTTEPPTTESPTAESPTETPTEPPPSSWLPTGTFALYAAGPWDGLQLQALAPGPTSTDLGRAVSFNSALSRTGRWIAHADSPAPATNIVVANLESGTTHTAPLTPDYYLYGMAFDHAETRLAFTELGGSGMGTYTWAIVVVNLADGSIARFEDTFTPPVGAGMMLSGWPIGWTAAGDELLLDTFMPDTEGNWAGVWAVTLPPGTPSAALNTLSRRVVIAGGDYSAETHLSADAARLLYLNRDYSYTPAGYTPMAYDLAVNQLGEVNIATGSPTLLVNVTDGGALARDAAWSQEAPHILFAQGNYAGDAFGSLMLKRRDATGTISDAGPVPLPPGGNLQSIDWCLPDFALVVVATADYDHQLHLVEFGGGSTLVASDAYISVLGCIP
ncbi:MAG: hypothetical protein JXA14_10910 [Anaerolineae bacterium]|nr:hypothetical protein [Anaerolineae bacterium]